MWMHVYGKTKKTLKWNPNLTYEKQKINKEIETQKHKNGQNRGILHERNKEKEAKKLGLGFLGWSMRAHT